LIAAVRGPVTAYGIGAGQSSYRVCAKRTCRYAPGKELQKTLQYDNDASFAPLSLLAVSPQILSVHPSVPAKNVKELIALAKASPGALIFSSAGPGSTSHLATELFMNMTGTRMIHVPYKGGGPSAQALLAGETGLSFVDVITALPFAKS